MTTKDGLATWRDMTSFTSLKNGLYSSTHFKYSNCVKQRLCRLKIHRLMRWFLRGNTMNENIQ